MKKLFIVGASILQLPAVLKAKELGLYVGVADYNPNAVAVPFADEFFNVSTIDESGVCAAAKDFSADGIMTLATDMPMRAVAYTCEQLGLTGISYDTAIKSTDKGEMIKAFDAAGVAHPWFYIITSPAGEKPAPEALRYPCIVKPTDNAGSRGVLLVRDGGELERAISYSSSNGRSGSVIIEEYLQGPEVSVEVMAVDGVAHVLQITDKLTTGSPHFVEMGHSQPSRLPEADVAGIKALAARAVRAVGIENGPAHVEIIVTRSGPVMVELGARMGGDCITTHLVPLSTGIDMVAATILLALGEKPDISEKLSMGAAIRYFDTAEGVIAGIDGVKTAQSLAGVKELSFTKNVGDSVGEIGSSIDRVGFVIAQGESPEKAVALCENAMEKINITVQGPCKQTDR